MYRIGYELGLIVAYLARLVNYIMFPFLPKI